MQKLIVFPGMLQCRYSAEGKKLVGDDKEIRNAYNFEDRASRGWN